MKKHRRNAGCWVGAATLTAALGLALKAFGQEAPGGMSSIGVVMQPLGKNSIGEQIRTATSTPGKAMKHSGLAAAMGGVRVKAIAAGTYDVLLPMPQLTDGQAPVCYSLSTTPQEALKECRLLERKDGNVFAEVKLNGVEGQEVKLDWWAVVLIGPKPAAGNAGRPEEYAAASSCVQSKDKQVKELAEKLWPGTGKTEDYARKIQEFIRDLKQKEQPRGIDAIGILKSGGNWICTANANLACALMRAKQVPCRSVAVIPPIARRLEMHRVVEYFDAGKWVSFDPSLLQGEIPLEPWHMVIMAKTTIADEERAMKPRVGSASGCPYGQEVEFAKFGLTLSDNDFYWTVAGPLAEFEVSKEAMVATADAWKNFLSSGKTSEAQLRATGARNRAEYDGAMKMR